MEDHLRKGWRTRFMPVEVGSLGFACHSLSKGYGTHTCDCNLLLFTDDSALLVWGIEKLQLKRLLALS